MERLCKSFISSDLEEEAQKQKDVEAMLEAFARGEDVDAGDSAARISCGRPSGSNQSRIQSALGVPTTKNCHGLTAEEGELWCVDMARDAKQRNNE